MVTPSTDVGVEGAGVTGISRHGRFILYYDKYNMFLLDRQSGWTRRLGSAYIGANQSALSADGHSVTFPDSWDILVQDRLDHRRKVSIGRGGHHANGYSSAPAVTQHGRFVAFESEATNLVWCDHNDNSDVFVRDRALHKTFLVSVGTSGQQGNRGSFEPVISAHGRFVAFSSTASNLVHGDNNSRVDVFMYDRLSHATRLISVGRDGKAGHGASYGPAISANARLVTFLSGAANLVLGDSNPAVDVFVAAPSGG